MQATGLLVKNSIVYFVANIGNALVPFIMLPVLTRKLDAAEFGMVAAFQILFNLMTVFVGMSTDGAVTRKYFDQNVNKKKLGGFISASLQVVFCAVLIVGGIGIIARVNISSLFAFPDHWVVIAIMLAGSTTVTQIFLSQLLSKNKPIFYGSMQLLQSLLNFFLSFLLVVSLHLGAEGRVMGQALAVCLVSIISLYALKKTEIINLFSIERKNINEILKFGLPLIPHSVGMFMLAFADRLVIVKELGLTDLGIYAVAVQIGAGLGIFFDAINKAYVPWLYKRLNQDTSLKKKQLVITIYWWYALIIIGVFLGFLIGPYFVQVVAGSNYSEAGKVIGWVICGQGFWGMYLIQTNFVFYSQKTGHLAMVTVASGVINIGLLIIVVPIYGVVGAGIVFALAMLIRFLLTWYVAQKKYPMPWFTFLRNIENA